jgi:Tol biopolymer transport system component
MRFIKPVALAATLALAVPAAPAGAASLRITFADKAGPGNTDLFTITPSGQGRQKITSGPAKDTLPTLSPARDLIAFTRDAPNNVRRLFAVGANGTGLHVIPNTLNGGAPSWSPDGSQIAFDTSHGDGPSRIFKISPTGTGRTQLTAGPADSNPDWSTDSKLIVFERQGQIWRMRADGSQLKKLTNKGKQPAWRPNDKHIAFVRKIDREGIGKSLALFVMEPDGSHVQQLTQKGGGKENDRRPAWEPNSRHLVYAATVGGVSKIRTLLFGGAVPAAPQNVTPGQTPAW